MATQSSTMVAVEFEGRIFSAPASKGTTVAELVEWLQFELGFPSRLELRLVHVDHNMEYSLPRGTRILDYLKRNPQGRLVLQRIGG